MSGNVVGTGDKAMSPKSDEGTTAMRNTLDITSLSSWMVCQSVLVHLLSIDTNVNDYYAGSSCRVSLDDARSLSREQWLKERLHVRQFGFGQSNPTYLLTIHTRSSSNRSSSSSDTIKSDDDDGGVVRLVLRRKPNMVAHPSSHALHREYRVLECLTRYNEQLLLTASSLDNDKSSLTSITRDHDDNNFDDKSIPVPHPYVYCSDVSIIGAEFYIMEYIEGRIFVDPRMTTMLTREERVDAYHNVIRVLSVSKR